MSATPMPSCAAVIYPAGCDVDALLLRAAEAAGRAGLRVVGAVQQNEAGDPGCCDTLLLRDLADGSAVAITENRGRMATGCRLDTRGLAEMAGRIEQALAARPDLLVLNRFGKAEIDGGGLRDVLGTAIGQGVPVLLAVKATHAADWTAFHQGLACDLPAEDAAIADWLANLYPPLAA